MRLLYVCHAPPCPPALGPARRHYPIVREASKRHDVTLVSFGTASDERRFHEHLPGACRNAVFVDMRRCLPVKAAQRAYFLLTGRTDFRRLYAARFQRAIDEVSRGGPFDVVMISTVMLARYQLPPAPCLGDTHNVEHEVCRRAANEAHDVGRRLYFRLQTRLTRREEQICASRVQFISTTSHRDREQFARWVPADRIFVIPNVVDVEAFARPESAPPRDEPTVVFTGMMSYYPNVHAARALCEEVLPRVAAVYPRMRMVIAGANPPAWLTRLRDRRVVVTGSVDDMRPWLWNATVFAMPLKIGGGTRLKALEAMAARVPIVSTSLGCEGLNVIDGREALLRDDPAAFADAVVQLIGSETLRRRIADAAFDMVSARFDLRAAGRALDAALFAVANPRGRAVVRNPHCGIGQEVRGSLECGSH